jgi:hypothetical protein
MLPGPFHMLGRLGHHHGGLDTADDMKNIVEDRVTQTPVDRVKHIISVTMTAAQANPTHANDYNVDNLAKMSSLQKVKGFTGIGYRGEFEMRCGELQYLWNQGYGKLIDVDDGKKIFVLTDLKARSVEDMT